MGGDIARVQEQVNSIEAELRHGCYERPASATSSTKSSVSLAASQS